MANASFGADQPRLFIMDSSRPNGFTTGGFLQNNNRYVCTIQLYDNAVPVDIPSGAEIEVLCKKASDGGNVFVLNKDVQEFSRIVSFTPDTNSITVNKWPAMVEYDGQMLLAVRIGGIGTYTVSYTVDKDRMAGNAVHHSEQPVSNLAKSDLSNVSQAVFDKKAKDGNFAQNDLEGVDLAKLAEKVTASDIGKQIKAVEDAASPVSLDRWLRQDPAFVELSKSQHPSTQGITPDDVKALFYANRYEETSSVDFTKSPLKDATTLLMVYQLNKDDQTIKQMLPPVAANQIVMVEVIRASGVTGGAVEFTAASGDSIDGANAPLEVDGEGYCGYFMPVVNERSYDFIAMPARSDSKPLEFVDGFTGKVFNAGKIGSRDKSIRVSSFTSGEADLSVATKFEDEGVMASVGWDELYNTLHGDSRIYFGDVRVSGGAAIHPDTQKKSFVIQDVDPNDDPLVSGGTTIAVGAYFTPADGVDDVLTQDGTVRIEIVDDYGKVLTDVNGDPCAVEIVYKAGDKQRPELYTGVVKAQTYTDVHMMIKADFKNEELLSVGAATSVFFQAISDSNSGGRAMDEFEIVTGCTIRMSKRYYGYNSMNLAQFLITGKPVQDVAPQTSLWGDSTYFVNKGNMKVGVEGYALKLKDNGTDLPVVSIVKMYGERDMPALEGKILNVSATIKNPSNAFEVALLRYSGSAEPELPAVQSYNNEAPVFPSGWSVDDRISVAEQPDGSVASHKKAMTVTTGSKAIAVVAYPVGSGIPTDIEVHDIEVDITPAETIVVSSVVENGDFGKRLRYMQESAGGSVPCPPGYSAYRYTAGSTETKIPAGVVVGGTVYNDHGWTEQGSIDPMHVQGDLAFDKDGSVSMEFIARCFNEKQVDSKATFWIAEVVGDTTSEVANSVLNTTIKASNDVPTIVRSELFSFNVKAGSKYRFMMQSDVDDGFYLQCSPTSAPLFTWKAGIDYI